MAVSQVAQILGIMFLVCTVCTAAAVLGVLAANRRRRMPQQLAGSGAEAAPVAAYEMQPVQVCLDNEEEAVAEADLAAPTCRLCGSACPSSCTGKDDADARLRVSPVRGEIFVTAADVGIRSASASDLVFFGLGGGGRGGGSGGACVAALPGRDYRAWHCQPDRHTGGSKSPPDQLCPHCRPLVSFRLQPGELVFHHADCDGSVWLAAFMEVSTPPAALSEAGRRPQLLYQGLLAGLKRLPCDGKLSIQFGADFDQNACVEADASQGDEEEKELDLSSQPGGVGVEGGGGGGGLGSVSQFSYSEFQFSLQAGLAMLPSQFSGSNDIMEDRFDDPGSLSDCGASSSTVSAQTDKSPVTYNTRKGSSSAKWAAIGMQEVANIIESSSSDEPPATAGGIECEAAEALRLRSQHSATTETVKAAAAAAVFAASDAAAAAAAAAAASEAEYLKFMFSDASSGDDDNYDGYASEGGGGGRRGSTGLSLSAEFHSAESNVTSLVGSTDGGLSAISSGQSDAGAD